jgi:hypothetical protein
MREIKFRAWHEYGNQTEKHTKPGMIYDENTGDCLHWKSQGQKIIAVMQFAGIYDKNGKEVYEGDRISLWWEEVFFKDTVVGEVVWSGFGWAIDFPQIGFTRSFEAFDLNCSEVEVIGNIYEDEALDEPDSQ